MFSCNTSKGEIESQVRATVCTFDRKCSNHYVIALAMLGDVEQRIRSFCDSILIDMLLQFNAEFIADMLSWVTVNGLEAFDVQPYLVGGDQAPLKSDTRKATMTAPPSTDTELERVRSLAYSKNGKSGIDIRMDVTDFNSLPMGIYPKSLTHDKAVVQRRLESDSIFKKFLYWVVKVRMSWSCRPYLCPHLHTFDRKCTRKSGWM